MAGSLRYLTVQDILWINVQVTRMVNSYHYARLEEATFYQYAYGDSDELVKQAQRFLKGFNKQKPFDAGNEATAFVACMTFLQMNGSVIGLLDEDASKAFAGSVNLAEHVRAEVEAHVAPVREAVTAVLLAYPKTVEALGGHALEIIADGAIH